MSKLLSVVVPVYNAESFLERCIDSILTQEYRELELILVDDGSTDKSGQVCDRYAETDPRVKVYHISNGGAAAARNYGMTKATGCYLGFIDSDDTIDPQMYRVMVGKAEEHQADVVICNYRSIQRDGSVNVIRLKGSGGVFDSHEAICNDLLSQFYTGKTYGLPNMVNKVYRADLIRQNALKVDEGFFRAEDYWFNFDVLKRANCVVSIDEAFYNYWHVNDNSVTCQLRDNRFVELKRGHMRLLEENKVLGLPFEVGAHNHFLFAVQEFILFLISQGRKEEVITIFKDGFYREILSRAQLTWWSVYIDRFILAGRYHIAYYLYCIFVRLNSIRRKIKSK